MGTKQACNDRRTSGATPPLNRDHNEVIKRRPGQSATCVWSCQSARSRVVGLSKWTRQPVCKHLPLIRRASQLLLWPLLALSVTACYLLISQLSLSSA